MTTESTPAIANRISELFKRLRAAGQRITPQRLAIIEMVFCSPSHPTAKQVHEALLGRYPTMSLMTVYKTLHMLQKLGEVGVVAAESDAVHYDGLRSEPHAHLVCRRCGAITDVADDVELDCLAAARRLGWQVEGWRLELAGLCPQCRHREE